MQDELLALPLRFKKNGFLYWQVCRSDRAAIYEQKLINGQARVYYEVWRIRVLQPRVFKGVSYPQREAAPSNADWGRYGWTFYTLGEAQEKYDQLNGRGL
jgi:hypothetical protein